MASVVVKMHKNIAIAILKDLVSTLQCFIEGVSTLVTFENLFTQLSIAFI